MARGRHPVRLNIDPPDKDISDKYLQFWSGQKLHFESYRFPPLTSSELFGDNRPLEIDFGCGTGVLACTRAQRFPNVNFLGIDLSQKPLYWAVRDAANLALNNIKFIRGNFNEMLPLLQPDTVAAAYYLLPNLPENYFNERANLRRRNLLQAIVGSLVPGGRFFFATDSTVYFECIKNILTCDLRFKALSLESAEAGMDTLYWKLWEEKGRTVQCLVIEKISIS
jgi:tRNA (guanine-N7-)-methyltransferase